MVIHDQVVLGTGLPPEGQVGAAGFIPLLTRELTLSALARLKSAMASFPRKFNSRSGVLSQTLAPYQSRNRRQQVGLLP